ncbi:hypothetical protein C8Q79DRAFT_360630 [Trametes meyenii]|nr:hypothetical protein C8Q79DRAFT_360630 [Trametes meyenii]
MANNEDAQPNEVRHARKGEARVPTVRSSRPVLGAQFRGRGPVRGTGFDLRGRGRGRGGMDYSRPSLGKTPGTERSQIADPGPSVSGRCYESTQPVYENAPTSQHAHTWRGRRGKKRKFYQDGDRPGPSPNRFSTAIAFPQGVLLEDLDGSFQKSSVEGRGDKLSLPTSDTQSSALITLRATSGSSASVPEWSHKPIYPPASLPFAPRSHCSPAVDCGSGPTEQKAGSPSLCVEGSSMQLSAWQLKWIISCRCVQALERLCVRLISLLRSLLW